MNTQTNDISTALFTCLNRDKIQYAVLRNYQTLPESLGGSDLDIWVSKKDCKKFYALINEVVKDQNAKIVSYLSDREAPRICILNKKSGIQIDVHEGIIPFQGNMYISEDVIQYNIINYNSLSVLDDTLSDLIAYLKEIIFNGTAANKYIHPLYKNKEKYTEEYIFKRIPSLSKEVIQLLHNAISSEELPETEPILFKNINKTIKRPGVFFKQLQVLSRLICPPGYMIAVLGTDGSGKSTIINAITPWLNEAFHNGTYYYHLRPSVLPDLGILLGKKKTEEKPLIVTSPHNSQPSGMFSSLIRWGYYLQDYVFGHYKKNWLNTMFRSKVVIFDRYYYDYYLDQRRFRTNIPKWILKIGDFFVPKPDLILCLGGDPQQIYKRKPETSLKEVNRQTEALKKFCSSRENAIWINTTLQPEESIEQAKEAILNMMGKRFEKTIIQ